MTNHGDYSQARKSMVANEGFAKCSGSDGLALKNAARLQPLIQVNFPAGAWRSAATERRLRGLRYLCLLMIWPSSRAQPEISRPSLSPAVTYL